MIALVPVFASSIGKIFQPIFQAMAWLIAAFYAFVPNYAIAIALLTVVVMIVTAPLTVKSTRSMMAMQRLSPELKKLQQKYKGDRQKLNEEMMSLYKEHGVNPAGGCLPMVIQFPVFIVLYDVIKGLTNTVKSGQLTTAGSKCMEKVCASPRYIGVHTKIFQKLVAADGKMPAFGINLASKVVSQHFPALLPYAGLILVAIGLQYLQMRQLNSRNKAMAQANPQAQMMQRYMPIIFAVIYINIAAGVNIYFIVSSLCRMGLQWAAFRAGPSDAARRPGETRISGAGSPAKPKGFFERLADAQRRALEAQQARQAALESGAAQQSGATPPSAGNGTRANPPAGTNGRKQVPKGTAEGTSGGTAAGGAGGASGNGAAGQARSKSKRTRKAR